MDHSIAFLPLNSGASIPQFGFGTYKLTGQDAYDGVRDALELGYRHIDTAQMYGNEAEVGRALADASLAREEIFVTSKLNNPNHEPDIARESLQRSLEDLQLDYSGPVLDPLAASDVLRRRHHADLASNGKLCG